MHGVYEIVDSTPAEVRLVRYAVLRPGQNPQTVVYPDDDDPDTLHLAARAGGRAVASVSLYVEALPDRVDPELCDIETWRGGVRIRGMATLEGWQGRGIGTALLSKGLERMSTTVPDAPAWCNARTTAAPYYEKVGFKIASMQFDIPAIGPHYVMVREATRA